MAKTITAADAFIMKLQMLYDMEKQLERALPKLAKAAQGQILKEGILAHLEETKNHSVRLEKIFALLNKKPKKIKSLGMSGIIEDAGWLLEWKASEAVYDSLIAGAARQAEHYEMATYLTAMVESEHLGYEEVTDLLAQTLEEEEAADEVLFEVMAQSLEDEEPITS